MPPLFQKRKKPLQTPRPIPVYTQGDDIIVNERVMHVLNTTSGADNRTQDNVITGPVANMNADQIKQAIKEFHERNH